MAHPMPITNLPTISAQEIHVQNLRAYRLAPSIRNSVAPGTP